MKDVKISFVIPCYGSEYTLEGVVNDIRAVMKKIDVRDYEIILVNDNSPDGVVSVIYKLVENDSEHICGIDLARNFGQHSALMAGYREVTGDIVVSLDDDGQSPASAVPDLINKLEQGYDVVYASYQNKKHSFFRNLGSRLNDWMAEIMLEKPKELYISSFFVARRFIIDELTRYPNAYPYMQGLVLRSTHNIGNCPVNHKSRTKGASGYTIGKLFHLWLNGFTSFSVKPLRISILCGFICAFLGFCGMLWMLVGHFIGMKPPIGYSSIMIVLLFIGGMLMIMLGLIGEYVGRTFICLNRAPQYVIRQVIGRKSHSQVDKNYIKML